MLECPFTVNPFEVGLILFRDYSSKAGDMPPPLRTARPDFPTEANRQLSKVANFMGRGLLDEILPLKLFELQAKEILGRLPCLVSSSKFPSPALNGLEKLFEF